MGLTSVGASGALELSSSLLPNVCARTHTGHWEEVRRCHRTRKRARHMRATCPVIAADGQSENCKSSYMAIAGTPAYPKPKTGATEGAAERPFPDGEGCSVDCHLRPSHPPITHPSLPQTKRKTGKGNPVDGACHLSIGRRFQIVSFLSLPSFLLSFRYRFSSPGHNRALVREVRYCVRCGRAGDHDVSRRTMDACAATRDLDNLGCALGWAGRVVL